MRVRFHLAVAAVAAVACGGCAAAPVEVPAQLEAPAGETRTATLAARGVQERGRHTADYVLFVAP